ncbi:hypothetical protein FA002_00410 [Priestia megaterium]|uniref:hypothetical protein n=1 Tax=Priestia megaterium TaxID=1404 RepID=UPI0010AC047C|nr:hypothetical protein [Priestia megaterium]TJZ40067.1 hypothetical protein FA002_00410 [Priestia megaterium]
MDLPLDEKRKIKEYDVVLVSDTNKSLTKKTYLPAQKGIAFEFAKLKTMENINEFARKYGLLGVVGDVEPKQLHIYKGGLEEEINYFEPLTVWVHQISNVRKFLYLFRALSAGKDKIEDGFFRSCIEDISFFQFEDNIYMNKCIYKLKKAHEQGHFLKWVWEDFKRLYPKLNEREIAIRVLVNTLPLYMRGGVHVGYKNLTLSSKSKLGYQITEIKYAENLLAEIYLDIWQMILDDQEVNLCENVRCGLPIRKFRKAKYCNNACKQEAYRYRKDILVLYNNGYALTVISKETGISYSLVEKIIEENIQEEKL